MVVWDWGYKNLFLCEYYLLTGDKEVLHAINEYTVTLAKGQGMYGTFGHGISDRTEDGKLHGSIPPYGPREPVRTDWQLGDCHGQEVRRE